MKKYPKSIILILVCIITVLSINAVNSDPFNKLKTVAQLVRYIYDYYVEDVDMDKVLNGALRGMLEELDPHSSFIDVEDRESIDWN